MFRLNKSLIREIAFIPAIFIFIISVVLSINIFMSFRKDVKLRLIGDKKVLLTVNTDYVEPGIEVNLNGKVLSSDEYQIKEKNTINNSVTGDYNITYKIIIDKDEYEIKRDIMVIDDIAPVISVNQNTVSLSTCHKSDDINISYTASDNYDGIITDKVKREIKNDVVILTVEDSSNNIASVEVPIEKSEDMPPQVNLNGKDIIYIPIGGEYIDEGATATDGCGNEVDESVVVSGSYDNSIKGEYELIYSITTSSGAVASVIRKIVVYDPNEIASIEETKEKVIYLTFDDGPGKYTAELLDILAKYNVKATFFVTAQFKAYLPLIERENAEGHAVAVHTKTHEWKVYKSVETYIKDFNDMNDIIEQYTGSKTNIFRFPGGGSNTISKKYSKGVVSAIASKMTELGYTYFDWNVDSEDAAGANSEQIYNNVTKGILKHNESVVLCHDIKSNTVNVIEKIIQYALENGYHFEVLTESSPTVHHKIQN